MMRLPRLALMLLACLSIAGCATSDPAPAGSETHFLVRCDATCPAPLACICGVCTVMCEASSACAEFEATAECLAVGGGVVEACAASADRVCDVACVDHSACADLGAGHRCEQGRCRAEAAASMPDAGRDDGAQPAPDAARSDAAGPGRDASVPMDAASSSDSGYCDGSNDVWLAFTNQGGFLAPSDLYLEPYGHAFLFVDGQCRYYVQGYNSPVVYQGELTEAEVASLAERLHYAELPDASGHQDGNCPDGTQATLRTRDGAASCSCGCDESAPAALAAAMLAVPDELIALQEAGTPLAGAVEAAALPYESSPVDFAAAGYMPWPLSTPVVEVPNFVADPTNPDYDRVARFEGDDAAALRTLRDAAAAQSWELRLHDGGVGYGVYVRDALPAADAAAFEAFLASAP